MRIIWSGSLINRSDKIREQRIMVEPNQQLEWVITDESLPTHSKKETEK